MSQNNPNEKRGRKAKPTISGKVMKYSKGDGIDKYNFLYNIPAINQYAVVKNGWELDIIDIAIYYCIENFISKGSPKKFEDSDGIWYWVDESKILKDMPLLPLGTNSSVYKRISLLVKCGLLERNSNNSVTRLKLLRIGINANKLFYTNHTNE